MLKAISAYLSRTQRLRWAYMLVPSILGVFFGQVRLVCVFQREVVFAL